MKKQKTFDADTDHGVVESWISEIMWDYNVTTFKPRDPAEWEYRLTNKVKVTLEIFDDEE